MEIERYNFKDVPNERFIANQPWMIALRKRNSAQTGAEANATADNHCLCRPTYKLNNIGAAERSSTDSEAWKKILHQAETQARVRAVQMHLNTVTTFAALPLSIKCCDKFQFFSASAALKGLYAEEIEREWIYDTGAATCIIGMDELTSGEKQRLFQTTPLTFTTAGVLITISTAVICNVLCVAEPV